MAAETTFQHRLLTVILPTPVQAVISLALGLIILEAHQLKILLPAIGVSSESANAGANIFHTLSSQVLTSQLASNTALIAFWAGVGLIAYLICWAAYNLVIEARNEVTLETQYTNRTHWRGPLATLGLKAAGAVLLVLVVATLPAGFTAWAGLAAAATSSPLVSLLYNVLAILGLAVQLYLILAFLLVTITPWYRPEAFTGQE